MSQVTISKSSAPSPVEYRFHEKLGEGGSGEVYKVSLNTDPSAIYAAKLFRPAPWAKSQFQREQTNLKTVAGAPHTIQLHSATQLNNRHTILTRFIAGLTLLEHIKKYRCMDDVRALVQLLEFLDYVHGKNLCYGDLKPENIIFSGPDGDLRVLDMESVVENGYNPSGMTGTNFYRSLLIWLRGSYKPSIDMHAFGLLLYEAFTGMPLIATNKTGSVNLEERNEYINLLVAHFGMPPASFLDPLKDTAVYFNKTEQGYTLRKPLKGEVIPWYTTMRLMAERTKNIDKQAVEELIDLISQCTRYEYPLTPSQAMSHPFFLQVTHFSLKLSEELVVRNWTLNITDKKYTMLLMSLRLSDTYKHNCLHVKAQLGNVYVITLTDPLKKNTILPFCSIRIKRGDQFLIDKNAFGEWTISRVKAAAQQLPSRTTPSV